MLIYILHCVVMALFRYFRTIKSLENKWEFVTVALKKRETVQGVGLLLQSKSILAAIICAVRSAPPKVSFISYHIPSSRQAWPLVSQLWAGGCRPHARSHQSCVLWLPGRGGTVSTFCLDQSQKPVHKKNKPQSGSSADLKSSTQTTDSELKGSVQDSEYDYTASSERQAVFVLLIRVQHAQSHCQLPFAVRDDGEGQLAALWLLTVVSQDVLAREGTHSELFKPS